MTEQEAHKLLQVALDCSRRIEASIQRVEVECDEGTSNAYRDSAARVSGYVFTNLLAPIYECYPNLAPVWYRTPPGGMSGALRKDLIDLMESVCRDIHAIVDEVVEGPDDPEMRPLQARAEEVFEVVRDAKEQLLVAGNHRNGDD